MNVALTRAKCSLWILGHHKSLVNNKLWKHLISDAKERNCLELACPGFLNPSDKFAQDTIQKFKGSHDYIANLDTYDPYQNNVPSGGDRNKHRFSDHSSSNQQSKKKLKLENWKKQRTESASESANEKPNDFKPSPATKVPGRKKKSSIFSASRTALGSPLDNASRIGAHTDADGSYKPKPYINDSSSDSKRK